MNNDDRQENVKLTALITGAAKRIGRQTAISLHNAGYKVILHYGQSKRDALALVDELNEKRAYSARVVQADLTDESAVHRMIHEVREIAPNLDVLVNNASSFFPTDVRAPQSEQTLAWKDLFSTNLQAPYLLSCGLLPCLRNANGCIINMVDIHANRPLKGHSIYCMAKAGLQMMTISLANEFAPDVRVNGVAPGVILWPEHHCAVDKEEVLATVPSGVIGHPERIAETILFLADKKSYINGQIINVDGGRSIAASQGL